MLFQVSNRLLDGRLLRQLEEIKPFAFQPRLATQQFLIDGPSRNKWLQVI